MSTDRGTWIAFLVMSFAVVGLAGLFATYALTTPWQRAAGEIAALDGDGSVADRVAAALGPDASRLMPDAASLAATPLAAPEVVGAELRAARRAVLARAAEDAESATVRTRWLIVLVTLTGAIFGIFVLGAAARARAC